MFNEHRAELCKAEDANFSIAQSVQQMGGKEQLMDNLETMFEKEAGRHPSQLRRNQQNLQHNPMDYLSASSISEKMREEAVLSILQFSVQTRCLD